MARSGIHYEDVKNAAETLLSRGLPPTIQRIREVLGTGSNTTISAHLKQWQQHMAASPRATLPPAIPEAVMTALETFWRTAVAHAEAAFAEHRAKAEHRVAAAEQARTQALAEAQQARSETAELQRQAETWQNNAHDLADRLLVEQERRRVAEAAIAAAEERAQNALLTVSQIRAETEARAAQLTAALHQARLDLEQQQKNAQQQVAAERQRSEASEARLMQHLDRLRQEYRAERQTFLNERQDWKAREQANQHQQEALRRENIELRTALAAAQERDTLLNQELSQLKNQWHHMENRLLEATREAERLRGELHALKETQEINCYHKS